MATNTNIKVHQIVLFGLLNLNAKNPKTKYKSDVIVSDNAIKSHNVRTKTISQGMRKVGL